MVGIELLVIANTNLFSLNKTSLVCFNFELYFLSGFGCLKYILMIEKRISHNTFLTSLDYLRF